MHRLVLVVVFEGHSGCVPLELIFFLLDAEFAFGQAASRYEAEHHCACKDLQQYKKLRFAASKEQKWREGKSTYSGGVEHAHALCVHEVRVFNVVEAHACLVRQEDSVLTENHRGCDAEEDHTDEGGEAAASAAR